MNVSIIIVNYNTEELTLNCIKSIIDKTHKVSYEIIIVDNASPIYPQRLSQHDNILYIQSDINLGFGKANNLGATHSSGDVLFFLNPDTILINDAISILYEYLHNHPETGICGGNLFSIDMEPAHSFRKVSPSILSEIHDLLNRRDILLKKIHDFNYSDSPLEVAYITGADLCIRKSLFNNIGGFNNDFFMYFEESYLCHLVQKKGYNIICIPEAHIIHLEGKSFIFKERREKLYLKGRKLYLCKRYGSFYYYLCNIIYFISCISRILAFTLIHNKEKAKTWKSKFKLLIAPDSNE